MEEFIQGLPGPVFWWGWAMLALLTGVLLYAGVRARWTARALAEAEPVEVSELSEGYRLAWGRVSGPELTAPLTGRRCAWWKLEVWESVREDGSGLRTTSTGGRTRYVWRQVGEQQSDRVVLFGDGKATCAVPAAGADVSPSAWSDWRGQENPPENRDPELRTGAGVPGSGIRNDVQGTFGPRFRYVEQYIWIDAPVFAMGAVEPVDRALFAAGPEPEDEPDPRADSGDDGLDGQDDWEAEQRWLEKNGLIARAGTPDDVHDADMASADWMFHKAQGRPFLLSSRHPAELGAEQELGGKAGLAIGAGTLVLALLAVWMRLAG